MSDPVAARLRTGHALAVTETALAFLKDARRRGETCLPLDWLPEVHHLLGNGEAVIPDALLYYRSSDAMLRAFVEVDRATMGPERLAAKLTAYARLHRYIPGPTPGRRRHTTTQATEAAWRQRYPLFPRLLFVLDGTGPTGVNNRIRALHAHTRDPAVTAFLRHVPALAAPLADLREHGPATPVWRPIHDPSQKVDWTHTHHP
ncbi:replication-relaxation family protein [Streptomyces niveus]|uniref:replication-relaxation family protein n=1 Tax=Streptomyces niveus TaxID=193462 RepID=UPI0038647449